MIDPTHSTITDFAWSPSGSKLGVLQLRKSSDVVLITDLAGEETALRRRLKSTAPYNLRLSAWNAFFL